jgi:dipeptidyl aminopeptidase/acylaminoacyl peptidase
MKSLVISLLVISTMTISPAQKRAFTIADLYKVKTVADPQYSPDGKKIAFTVTESFLAEGKTNADVYIANADGTDPKNVTNNPASDNHPRWSPDGKWLLFVSSRSDGDQIWLLPAAGGDAVQLTDISTGAGDPVWSPDGKQIAFSSDVYPECGAVDSCNRAIDNSTEKGPMHAHITDHLLYRHWTFWKDQKNTHTFVYDLQAKSYRDVTPGAFDAPAWEQGGIGFAFSPDAKELCIVSNHDPVEARSTNKDLWLTSLADGTTKNITEQNKAYDGNPVYSPDGKYIAYKMQTIPAYESDRLRIALYNRKSGTTTVLTDAFDNWVNDFAFSPDSKALYFTGQVKGHTPLYRVEIGSKNIKEIIDAKTIDAFDVAPNGKTIAFARRSVGEPVELWRCGSDGKDLAVLTSFNKQLAADVDIRPAEEMWISSPTGAKIHTFIVKPHNFDPAKKYPLILNVHGGPQSQWADAFRGDWQVYPGSGYIVAFPNPHGSTGYGQEFTAEISKDFGGKVYEDVMAVADSLEKISWVDASRMGAMGWSYGGYMMMWLEGHTSRFKAIVSMMGLYDLPAFHGATEELWFPEWDLNGLPSTSEHYIKFSPNHFTENFKTPCLVITGEKDYRVPYTQSLEFFTDLQQMNVPSRLIVFPNDGHWPSGIKSMPLYYNAHLDWFHTYLGGDPAPYDNLKIIRNQAYTK